MKMPSCTGNEFEICPEGNHAAVCVRLIDLGTQQTNYQGRVKKQRKLYVEFQVPGERTEDDQPFVIGERYTFSSAPKSNLRKHLESWRGKRYRDDEMDQVDLTKMLGHPGLIAVSHSDNGYANIDAITPLPKGMSRPELEGSTRHFSLEPDEFDSNVFDSLSEKLQETIRNSPEFLGLASGGHLLPSAGGGEVVDHEDGEAPF
jgi:hypothetical protein